MMVDMPALNEAEGPDHHGGVVEFYLGKIQPLASRQAVLVKAADFTRVGGEPWRSW